MLKASYNSGGAFTLLDLYKMPVYLRSFYITELGKIIAEENKTPGVMDRRTGAPR